MIYVLVQHCSKRSFTAHLPEMFDHVINFANSQHHGQAKAYARSFAAFNCSKNFMYMFNPFRITYFRALGSSCLSWSYGAWVHGGTYRRY